MMLESATGRVRGQVTYCFANGYNISKNYAADKAAALLGRGAGLHTSISLKPGPVLGAVQEAPVDSGNRINNDPLNRFGLRPPPTGDPHVDLVEARGCRHFVLCQIYNCHLSNFLLRTWKFGGKREFPKRFVQHRGSTCASISIYPILI